MSTHRGLVALASYYDGRSCGAEGDSADSITAQESDGSTDVGARMDHIGTFSDLQQCCIVQKCVFGETPAACQGLDLLCPSRWGRVNPRTCEEEAPKLDEQGQELDDDAHRQGYYRSQKECCHAKIVLDGCTARSPRHKQTKWEAVCCGSEDGAGDAGKVLDSGAPRAGEEDYLTV